MEGCFWKSLNNKLNPFQAIITILQECNTDLTWVNKGFLFLTLSYIMLENDQTYFKSCGVNTARLHRKILKVYLSFFQH